MPTATVPKLPVVYNHDVKHLDALLRRATGEMHKSTSSNTSSFNKFDQERIIAILLRVDKFHVWANSQPLLDVVEDYPIAYTMEAPPETPDVENEDVNTIVTLLEIARQELLHSQSARLASGFSGHDSKRLTAIIEKTRQLVTGYIAETQPTDFPKTSPSEPMSGPGKKGT